MAPSHVIERLDVIEDGKLCVPATGRNRFVQAGVALVGAPERFHGGVVVAVPGPLILLTMPAAAKAWM